MDHALGLLRDPHDDRDLRFSRVASDQLGLDPLPPVVDLRPSAPPIRDQGREGACTGFALTALAEILARLAGPPLPTLSPQWLYYWERRRERTIPRDGGANIRDGLHVLQKLGCATEVDWAYSEPFDAEPTPLVPDDAAQARLSAYHRCHNLIEMKQALALQQPVAIGVAVFPSFESEIVRQTGRVPVPDVDHEPYEGGHALCVVGYSDPDAHCIVRNSWGTDFGDGGYLYLPYLYFAPALGLVFDMWSAAR